MAQLKGMAYLKRKLAIKQERVDLRYKHYEMKHLAKDMGISTPQELRHMKAILGWCGMAVDKLADRLVFREFRDDNFDLTEIYLLNNSDVLLDSAVLSALIGSCSFIYISQDENKFPKLQVIDGRNATGEIDNQTGLLTEGYAVLQRDSDTDVATLEAYFIPGRTYFYSYGKLIRVSTYKADYPMLVPIINRPDAKRPFGHSRISRACMYLADAAARTLLRSEITAEFYSFPQKWATGTHPEKEEINTWRAAVSYMLTFDRDEDGEHPVLGQFTQQSTQPHIDQLKMFASAFAGETGLTLDDLGFPQDNPSSVEAIKAAHESLRLTSRKAQRTFGTGFLNAGYLAACIRDDYAYKRSAIYMTKPIWEPVFEPDAAALSGIGDAVLKLNQAIDGYVTEEKMRDMTGF